MLLVTGLLGQHAPLPLDRHPQSGIEKGFKDSSHASFGSYFWKYTHRTEPIIIRNSRWGLGFVLLASLAFMVVGIFMLLLDGRRSTAWIVIIGGVCAAFALLPLMILRPRVVIDGHGINDLRLRFGLIPWSEISDA